MLKQTATRWSFYLFIILSFFGSSNQVQADLVDFANPGASLNLGNYQFIGENANDAAGSSVSSAGDVDGDGLSDLLISAYGNDDGGSYAGKAYLILSSNLSPTSSTVDLSRADYQFIGENIFDIAGWSISSAGDVDGDGLSDLLIGASNDDGGSYAGKAYLILGSSLGSSSTIDLSAADYQFIGESEGDIAGFSVSSAGDVDGDGLSDILIGAYHEEGTYAGKFYLSLILGASLSSSIANLSTADYQFTAANSNSEYAGRYVSSSGDVDGDGRSDILIGEFYNEGRAYLVLGSSLGSSSSIDLESTADYQFIGENSGDSAGYSVSMAGDIDGDGLKDILIGAQSNDDGGSSAGKVYLILSENHCDPDDLTDTVYVDGFPAGPKGLGTEECPLETIASGINKAISEGLSNVVVQGWFYDETVTLETGIQLVGNTRTFFFEDVPALIYDSTGTSDYLVQGANESLMENFVIDGGVQLDGVNNMTFKQNYIYRDAGPITPGLDLIGGASNNTIENNVIYTYNNHKAIVSLDSNSDENVFINNTLYSLNPGGLTGSGATTVGIYLAEYTNDNEFRNNIIEPRSNLRYRQTPYGFYLEDTTTITATIAYNKTPINNYNVTLNVSNLQTRTSCDFEDPPPSGTNFHLTSSSICIDRGDRDSSYNDTDGTRNDLGAYGGPSPR